MKEKRNLICVYVKEDFILNVFTESICQFYKKYTFDLPKGYEILRIWHVQERLSFCFLIYHKSFPLVKNGHIPEEKKCVLKCIELEIKRRELRDD